jgi:hypothetical protein
LNTRLLIVVAAIALPFAAFWLYRMLMRRRGRGADPWPTTLLWIAGAVLAAEALALAVLSEKATPPGRYEPARLEGDRIVPERIVPE